MSPGEAATAALATTGERAAAPAPGRRAEGAICRVLKLLTEPGGSCCPLTLALRHASPRALGVAAALLGAREAPGPGGFWTRGAATLPNAADAIAGALYLVLRGEESRKSFLAGPPQTASLRLPIGAA